MDEAPHRLFKAPREEARQRFDESLAVLRKFFLGRPFSYQGRFFDLEHVVPSPAPVQRPHPPIYVVANNPLSLDAAAEQGMPVFVNGAMRIGDIEQTMQRYRARALTAGFDPENVDIPVNRFVFVGESRAHAHRIMREPFLQFLERRAPDLRANLESRFGERARSFEFLAREICIFDDPEGVAARLLELEARTGMSHALCTFNLVTLDHRLAVESMRRFAQEVAPRLPARGPVSLRSEPPESMVRAVTMGPRTAPNPGAPAEHAVAEVPRVADGGLALRAG
jgi:alkanesulfonate monooxygenase SsuD/methylene tetrahydromethanopterin reductase-like flavin-dependent oxidoreductase (luciferase family)